MTVVAAGTRLGPYEVVSRVGAGGMGEVWKARDTRLDRSVAIKILPAGLAEDAAIGLKVLLNCFEGDLRHRGFSSS